MSLSFLVLLRDITVLIVTDNQPIIVHCNINVIITANISPSPKQDKTESYYWYYGVFSENNNDLS